MTAFISTVPKTVTAGQFLRRTTSPMQLRFRATTSFIAPVRVGGATKCCVSPNTDFAMPRMQEAETDMESDLEPDLPIVTDEGEGEDSAAAPVHEDAKLFVGNLSWNTTDSSLGAAFEPYGTVIDARVIFDRYTGKSRGFGFIEFEDPSSAQNALEGMNGILVDGRAIRVDRANRRQPRENNARY